MAVAELTNGRWRLAVSPTLGCRWLSLRYHDASILWEAPSEEAAAGAPFSFGLYLMAPWCNRLPGGRFTWSGRTHALRPNFPDGSAIHGDAMNHAWTVDGLEDDRLLAHLDARGEPRFNFPFPFLYRHEIRLEGARLWASLSVENVGTEPAPAALGFHPFFPRSPEGTAPALLVDAPRAYPAGPLTPGRASAVGDDADFRAARSLADRVVDRGFVFDRGAAAVLHDPDGDMALRLEAEPPLRHLFVYAPLVHDGAPAPFVCVEPMTMAAGGFDRAALGDPDAGVRALAPGETLTGAFALETRS